MDLPDSGSVAGVQVVRAVRTGLFAEGDLPFPALDEGKVVRLGIDLPDELRGTAEDKGLAFRWVDRYLAQEMTRWFTRNSVAYSLSISIGACVSAMRAAKQSNRSPGGNSSLRKDLSGNMAMGLHGHERQAQVPFAVPSGFRAGLEQQDWRHPHLLIIFRMPRFTGHTSVTPWNAFLG